MTNDGDRDKDDLGRRIPAAEDDDVLFFAKYGSSVSPTERLAAIRTIEHYYRAAAAANGQAACALIADELATGLSTGAAPSGASGVRVCAAAASRFFISQRARLSADHIATMRVLSVHANRSLGVAVLEFQTRPLGEILLARERGAWRIDALLDSQLT